MRNAMTKQQRELKNAVILIWVAVIFIVCNIAFIIRLIYDVLYRKGLSKVSKMQSNYWICYSSNINPPKVYKFVHWQIYYERILVYNNSILGQQEDTSICL